MGRESYGSPSVHVYIGDTAHVRIGSFVSIADDVEFFVGGNHRTDWVSTFPFRLRFELPGGGSDGHPASKGDVLVGNDVWIGRGAKVLSGVHIGNGAVVGAYAVVTKSVRPYAIVAGNPAREIRRRFTDDEIDALQAIAWWDWPLPKLREHISLLSSAQVEAFIDRFAR
jgi:acetyltransferase-like isoleucine patch superfamily enzyme